MTSDNLCKLLVEKYPDRFAAWVWGCVLPVSQSIVQEPTTVLKTELSIEPIRADSVIFLQTTGRILHIEFQTTWQSEPPMPLRLLDYWVRLHRLYRLPVTQVVIVLTRSTAKIESVFELEATRHTYHVIKCWEQAPSSFLQDPILLPFATLAQTQNPQELLQQIVQKVQDIPDPQNRREVMAYVQLMAGLKYDREEIRRIFREGIMRESVIYQEILQEGRQEGRQEGEQLGLQRVAINMLKENLPIEQIAHLTGLTSEQVRHIQHQLS